MNIRFSRKARSQYRAFPAALQQRIDRQFQFLLLDIRYPSLRAKKYDEARGVWQGRVDIRYRFYFQIIGNTYFIITITPHPK